MNKALVSAWILLSAACAHEPAVQEISATAIPSDEVAKLETDFGQAVSDQIDVLAPTNMEKAKESLREAKEGVKDKDDAKDVLRQVAVGKAYLARAREFAKIASEQMSEIVATRTLALNAGAKDAFGSDFRDADQDLRKVSADIEENKTDRVAKERTEILNKYLDLEVRAIRRTNLNAVEGLINGAKKDNADDWAPQSLTLAEKSLKDADNFIISNRHDTARIKELSDKALADANKLILINKEARNGTKATGEQAALKLFAEREKVAAQQSQLANAQTKLNQANTEISQAADSQKATAAALATSESFNQKFEQARAKFKTDEAEVYRQGDNLVIRLKGLAFNNAKSTLKGSNFPLLAKVKDVIGDLGAKSVVIEGHTDAVGSKEQNDKLSEARADAVKSYFESNPAEGVTAQYSAMGYGFQKPIASNKTATGRAQNRRVDVVIHTQTGG